jgi:hypothetical protein
MLLDFIILITFDEEYKLQAPPHAVISSLLLLHPSSVQIFFSAPCSQMPSVYVLPLTSKAKFGTHANHEQNYIFV